MRIVGVSRILDEADIVEAFIRHHASLLDLHILLDNGSSDGTVDILRALHAEGIELQVYQNASPVFSEALHNTGLYRLALQEGADWVPFLDADELLCIRGPQSLAETLDLAPPSIACLRVDAFRYRPGSAPEHPLDGLGRREPESHMSKIIARRLDPARINIYAGNHGAFVDGVWDGGLSQDRLFLAHVQQRSPLQTARRTILGRMKVIASGAAIAEDANVHIIPDFQALKTDARRWLDAASAESTDSVEEAVPYRGTPLRYTPPPDELARLLQLFAARGERLAKSHGDILDRKRLIKKEIMDQAKRVTRII